MTFEELTKLSIKINYFKHKMFLFLIIFTALKYLKNEGDRVF